jgi:hypothetical protein
MYDEWYTDCISIMPIIDTANVSVKKIEAISVLESLLGTASPKDQTCFFFKL